MKGACRSRAAGWPPTWNRWHAWVPVACMCLLSSMSCDGGPIAAPDGVLGDPGFFWYLDGPDSIHSRIDLVVIYRDSTGAVAEGVPVSFRTLPVDSSGGYPINLQVNLFDLGGGPWEYSSGASRRTGPTGGARASVKLGPRAQRAHVLLDAQGVFDTAFIDIQPGRPVGFELRPDRRGVTLGASAPLEPSLVDRKGNGAFVSEASVRGYLGRVALQSGQVTGVTYGVDTVEAALDGWDRSRSRVAVVPAAEIVILQFAGPTGREVVTAQAWTLDGITRETIATLPDHNATWPRWNHPMWHAASRTLVYQFNNSLMRVSPQGRISELLTGGVRNTEPLEFLPSGSHLMFSTTESTVRAIALDGGEVLWEVPGRHGTLGPGAQSVAIYENDTIKIVDVASQEVESLGLKGRNPRWSPRGDLIAYWSVPDAQLMIVRVEDGVARPATRTPVREGLISWSPDGGWLMVSGNGGDPWLVNLADEAAFDLPHLYLLRGVAFVH